MKYLLFILVLFLGFSVSGFAAMDEGFSGQTEPDDDSALPAVLPKAPGTAAPDAAIEDMEKWARDYELMIGAHLTYFDYREAVPSPLKSTETGPLWGLMLSLTHRVRNTDQKFHLDASFSTGNTVYDGTTQTGTPVLGTTADAFWDVHFQYGFGVWNLCDCHRIRLLTGLNYRYWRRYGQYREDYSWWEIPIGLSYESEPNEDFSYELQGLFNWQHGGHIKVFFSGYDPNLQDADGIVGDSVGLKFQAQFSFFRRAFIPLIVMPWVEYIHLDQGPEFPTKSASGTLQGTAFEPASRAWRIGVLLGTAFAF